MGGWVVSSSENRTPDNHVTVNLLADCPGLEAYLMQQFEALAASAELRQFACLRPCREWMAAERGGIVTPVLNPYVRALGFHIEMTCRPDKEEKRKQLAAVRRLRERRLAVHAELSRQRMALFCVETADLVYDAFMLRGPGPAPDLRGLMINEAEDGASDAPE